MAKSILRDPTTGRYIQADPLGLVDGASVYGYAGQNPGRWSDFRGESVVMEAGMGGGARPVGGGPGAGSGTGGSATGTAPPAGAASGAKSVLSLMEGVQIYRGKEMCDDVCEEAKERVRKAKKQKPNACEAGDNQMTLWMKFTQWRELCSARRERDRVCPALELDNPPGVPSERGEAERRIEDCKQATQCAMLIVGRYGGGFDE